MPCRTVKTDVGVTMVCGPTLRPKIHCYQCGKPGQFLCDGFREGKLCDRPLCYQCRQNRGKELDYCADCVKVFDEGMKV